jgi:biopolymer transport protein ExbD
VVTANFATGEGVLTTNLPSNAAGDFAIDAPPVMPLRVYLYEGDNTTAFKIRVVGQTDQPQTFGELATIFEQLSQHMSASDPVIIQPVGNVKWEHVLGAFNAAIKAKFQNVQFGEQAQ